jgi:hypothetical protein
MTAIAAELLAKPHNVLEFSPQGDCTRHRESEPDKVHAPIHRVKPQMDAHVFFYRLWLDRVVILARVLQTKTRLEAERIEMSIPRLPTHTEYLLRAQMVSELPFLLAA